MIRQTIYITVVLDARRDMHDAGYDVEHDAPFIAAYCRAADTLQRAVNRTLGGHRVDITISKGSYEGPEMQNDHQPQGGVWGDPSGDRWPDHTLWQRLHDMTIAPDDGETNWGCVAEADPRDVRALREWTLDEIHASV